MKKITIFNNILFSIIPFIFGLLFFSIANAGTAEFYLEDNYDKESGTLEVSFNISSNSKINASQSTINFDNKNLEIESINKNDSIFNLWIKSPKYSNPNGTISFAGGTTDGFIGYGKLFTVKFKIKNHNSFNKLEFRFNKSYILAHNGKGTNILSDSNKEYLYFDYKKISMK